MTNEFAETENRTNHTRETLLLKLRKDGTERELAWEEFFRIYSPIIVAFARHRGASLELADEVTQEVLKRFFQVRSFVYVPSKGRFRGYLKTCAMHVLDDLRKSRLHEIEQLSDVADETTRDDEWELEWQRRRLSLAMERVRQQYSRRSDSLKTFNAFEQCALFQRPAGDVGKELGMSIESVHAAKSRVLESLRTAVNELVDLLD